MKRIIVEGMDSTGKSTIIEYLKREHHSLVTVVNTLGPEQDFDTWWPAQLSEKWTPFVPIHDRFFYSEIVYGPILRGYVKATSGTQYLVARELRANALLIYARPGTIDVMATFGNKEQMEGVHDKFDLLLKRYDVIMQQERPHYGDRFTYYDWRDNQVGGHKELSKLVERYLAGELQ